MIGLKHSKTLLSTKLLCPQHKLQLSQAGFIVTDYDAIWIEPQKIDGIEAVENAIITSKNAANILIESGIVVQNSFCVGDSVRRILESEGFWVAETAQNANELGKHIVAHHSTRTFDFFCSAIRRDELPDLLHAAQIRLREHIVYHTYSNTINIGSDFDAILFFSPSAVQSYCMQNCIGDSTCFCIGQTTANTVSRYTKKIHVPKFPSIDRLVTKAIAWIHSEI